MFNENNQPIKKDIFNILRALSSEADLTQRSISAHLGISLGKTNYLLKSLAKKGFLKIKNFTAGDKKLKKAKYFLTGKGLEQKIILTYHFLKEKESEYGSIKTEWEQLSAKQKLSGSRCAAGR